VIAGVLAGPTGSNPAIATGWSLGGGAAGWLLLKSDVPARSVKLEAHDVRSYLNFCKFGRSGHLARRIEVKKLGGADGARTRDLRRDTRW